MESTDKKYSIVYADPPWGYKGRGIRDKGRSPENYYDAHSFKTLQAMKVSAISAEDSVLFMWASFPVLPYALLLGASWGFCYKTVAFVWIKRTPHTGHFFTGLGYYTRTNAEIVLLFTRGQPLTRSSIDVGQIVFSKPGTYSTKPPEVRSRIIRLFGDLPRVELFARRRKGKPTVNEYKGWDVFGDQVNDLIALHRDGIE